MSETQPQFNQLDEQLNKNLSATMLVERTNGEIHTAQVFDRGYEGKTVVEFGLDEHGNDLVKTVPNEKLSDEYQQKLARELGGKALHGNAPEDVEASFDRMMGVENPKLVYAEGTMSEPPKAKSKEEKAIIQHRIDDALAEKKRAQKEGRGEDSHYWESVASQYMKDLKS